MLSMVLIARSNNKLIIEFDRIIMNRRYARRQSIYLPPINPQFNPPKALQSFLHAPLHYTNTDKDISNTPKQYLYFMKKFERDFSNNKLQNQFDKLLQETLKNVPYQNSNQASQQQFVKNISRQVKKKLFQQYLVKRRSQSSRAKKILRQRQSSLFQKMSQSRLQLSALNTLSSQKLNDQRILGKVSSNRIFGVQSTLQRLQQKSSKNLTRKSRNYRPHHQLINPLLFINL